MSDKPVGFNLRTQKLHCLMLIDDALADVLSDKAGEAFWRAFIVEERETGEISANFRFRYTDHDAWFSIHPGEDKQKQPHKQLIEELANGLEKTLRACLFAMSRGKVPAPKWRRFSSWAAISRFYPPDPEDGEKTAEYLIQEDLVAAKAYIDEQGQEIPLTPEGKA